MNELSAPDPWASNPQFRGEAFWIFPAEFLRQNCERGGLSPQVLGKCLHRQSGLRASPLTLKNSTIKNRGQLLSFLFAVAPNLTMSL